MSASVALDNVVELNRNNAYESIYLFLETKGDRSMNTKKNYQSWLEDFFMYTAGKDMKYITWTDILNVTHRDILKYRRYLTTKRGNGNKTANTKIIAIRSLWGYLRRDCKEVDPNIIEIESLIEDVNKYGSLTEKEYESLLKYCEGEKRKPLEKKYFFKITMVTGLRKSAILSLRWCDIKIQLDNKTGIQVYVIQTKDKGKIVRKPINKEFYHELLVLRTPQTKEVDRIISITDKTLSKVLDNFCGEHGIDKSRNIVLHSLKKSSMDKVWYETKDIMLTAQQGNHTSIKYAYETYVGRNESLIDNPSYNIFSENNDGLAELGELSKEELLSLIKRSGKWVANELVKNL